MQYRVWTKNFGGSVSIMTDWLTHKQCVEFVEGRWGHWPPFAFISQCKTSESFRQHNGD